MLIALNWLIANWSNLLQTGANVAQIATGVVATWIGLRIVWAAKRQRVVLEHFLRQRGEEGETSHLNELIALSGMTEQQIFDAALASRHIHMKPAADPADGSGGTQFHYSRASLGKNRSARR